MSAPLSHRQKALLAQLAGRAYRAVEPERATLELRLADFSYKAVDEFRHREVIKACGKAGLRCCSQDDYKLVEAHFLELCGEHAAAFEAHVRAQTEPRRQAEAVLWRELSAAAKVGIGRPYIESICRNKFKCGILDCSDRQLWVLVYDLRRSVQSRKKKQLLQPA